MLRTLFIGSIVLIFYFTYISPLIANMKSFTKDETLTQHLEVFNSIKGIDPRSHGKAHEHLKSFMLNYSHTYQDTTSSMRKMKHHKYKAVGYLQRMIHRIPNDATLEHDLVSSLESVDNTLNNYLMEASDRQNEYYFAQDV